MKYKTLSNKIWMTIMVTIATILLLALLVNVTVLSNVKDEVIFDQLEDIAESKLERENDHQEVWIPHFLVTKRGGNISMKADAYTSKIFEKEGSIEKLHDIAKGLNFDESERGKYVDGNVTVFYLTQPLDDHEVMLFVQDSQRGRFYLKDVLAGLLAVFIISFLISRLVARSITKPLKQLAGFADQVAKGDWNAKMPITVDDEIGQLANSLDSMKNDLKEAFEKEREFLQSASHDMKTPIMIIKGYSQAAIDGMSLESDEETFKTILSETERLERRVKQLLDYSTLDQLLGNDELKETIRLDRLILRMKKQVANIHNHLSFEVDVDEVELMANPEMIRIALENILHNQLRYAQSLISIELKVGHGITISFFNDGDHIDDGLLEGIFHHGMKSADGNHGLGLTITHRVIESMDGSIEVKNVEGGVLFTIRLENA